MWRQWIRHQYIELSLGTMGMGPPLGWNTNRLYDIEVSTICGYGDHCIW